MGVCSHVFVVVVAFHFNLVMFRLLRLLASLTHFGPEALPVVSHSTLRRQTAYKRTKGRTWSVLPTHANARARKPPAAPPTCTIPWSAAFRPARPQPEGFTFQVRFNFWLEKNLEVLRTKPVATPTRPTATAWSRWSPESRSR